MSTSEIDRTLGATWHRRDGDGSTAEETECPPRRFIPGAAISILGNISNTRSSIMKSIIWQAVPCIAKEKDGCLNVV